MNRIMKGYGVDSIFERASYTKTSKPEKTVQKHSVLELDVYNRDTNVKEGLWGNIRRERETKNRF